MKVEDLSGGRIGECSREGLGDVVVVEDEEGKRGAVDDRCNGLGKADDTD